MILNFGKLIHNSIKSFCDKNIFESNLLYNEIYDQFISIFGKDDYLLYFWQPFFKKISDNFVNELKKDGHNLKQMYTEINGTMFIDDKFTINARADRIDVLNNEYIRIIDYKTGKIPDEEDIVNGKHSQLIIESLIAQYGYFEANSIKINGIVDTIKYYSLKSDNKDFGISYQKDNLINKIYFKDVLNDTYQGVKYLCEYYSNLSNPYIANNEIIKSDYGYLKRFKEWGLD